MLRVPFSCSSHLCSLQKNSTIFFLRRNMYQICLNSATFYEAMQEAGIFTLSGYALFRL